MEDALSYLGEVLMREVRDRTIEGFDNRINGKMRDAKSQKLFEESKQIGNEEYKMIEKIIPQVVDLCIHNILCMIEDNSKIDVRIDDESVDEISDGLAGELYTKDGWIHRFSKQRYEEI